MGEEVKNTNDTTSEVKFINLLILMAFKHDLNIFGYCLADI